MCLRFDERCERDDACCQGVGAPPRPSLEKLWPRGAENEERNMGHPRDQVLDEVEHGVVGPVQILEHEHRRSVLRQLLDEPAPGGEGLGPAVAEQRSASVQADQRPEMAFDPGSLVTVADQQRDGLSELGRRSLRFERVGQPQLGLDDLGQSPEGSAAAIWR